jgi:hypothetical protein
MKIVERFNFSVLRPICLYVILGLEWCMSSNISEVLGFGHRLSQGKGRVNLCSCYKGSLSVFVLAVNITFQQWIRPKEITTWMYFSRYHLQVLLNDGKTERVILAHQSGLEASQEAITEYRVLGPMISGCSWIELRPVTSRKHQVPCCVLSVSLMHMQASVLICQVILNVKDQILVSIPLWWNPLSVWVLP